MTKATKIWMVLVLLPIPLYLSMFILGLIGLAGYWGLPDSFGKYSRWYYVGDWVGWVSGIQASDLQQAIQNKESKIKKYKKKGR